MDEGAAIKAEEDDAMSSASESGSGDSDSEAEGSVGGGGEGPARAYLPGEPLQAGEQLVCDESAYVMYHQAQTGAPCLSFDVLSDKLGDRRDTFPLTCYVVAGTQAEQAHTNSVVVMRMHNLHRTEEDRRKDKQRDAEQEESESEEEMEEEGGGGGKYTPQMDTARIQHAGAVNRIRAAYIGEKHIACTWSENGSVHVWDLSPAVRAVNDPHAMKLYLAEKQSDSQRPLFTFKGHQSEGFAMDWSKLTPGQLITGDCRKNIHLWQMIQGGSWSVDQRAFTAHTASVEDLQWSPSEPKVFASCSVDQSVRVWDVRAAPHKACMITVHAAHDADVNVISWNQTEARFIASGGDDGLIKVWDLAQYKKSEPLLSFAPVAKFKHHSAPITSIEWHPSDASVFAAAGADDQLTLWDIAMERGDDEAEPNEPDVLPQLLFIHQGQKEIKELHWHPQIPGVVLSTALSGFNVFKTISV